MLAPQFIEANKDLRDIKPEGADLWALGYLKATRHTQEGGAEELYQMSRPHEDKVFTEYRLNNERHFTREVVEKWLSKTKRIYQSSIKTSVELSEVLKENLSDYPFYLNGEKLTFDKWVYDCIVPMALDSCNSIVVEIPFNPDEPKVAPNEFPEDGGLSPNMPLQAATHIVPHYEIQWIDENLIIWFQGTKKVRENDEPVYWVQDRQAFYIAEPYENGEGGIEYRLGVWYKHNEDRLIYTSLPGRIARKDKIKYRVSFLASAFEYGDAAIVAHSNDEVVRIKHGNPKMWIKDAQCSACGGKANIDEKQSDGSIKKLPCKTCNGSGYMLNPGPFGHIKVASNGINKTDSGPPAGYLNANTAILEHGWKVWREYLNDMKLSCGLDLLEGTAGESGKAKELRLETLQDLIKELGDSIIDFMESVLNNKETLLVPTEDNRQYISFSRPSSYHIKTTQILIEEATEAPRSLKKDALMNVVRSKYRDNEMKVKAYEVYYMYAPLAMFDELKERTEQVLAGAYNEKDLIRADMGLFAIEDILTDPRNEDLSPLEYFELADQWLIDNGKMAAPETLIDEQESLLNAETVEELPDNLDTSEEVLTAYVNGEIEKEIAAKILSVTEGISIDEAISEIDNLKEI